MNTANEAPQSALRVFLDEIVNEQHEFIHTEIEPFKVVVLAFLQKNKTVIREHDRRKMMLTVQREEKLDRLQAYIYNSLLAYEGLGVISLLPR